MCLLGKPGTSKKAPRDPEAGPGTLCLLGEEGLGQQLPPSHQPRLPMCLTGPQALFFLVPTSLLLPPRFESLQGHLATRRLHLQTSVELCRFCHLSNLELLWVAEHMPSSGPVECWASVQSLRHRHKVVAPSSPRISDTCPVPRSWKSSAIGLWVCWPHPSSGCPGFQTSVIGVLGLEGLAKVGVWSCY